MPSFTLSPSKPAKFSDANGKYTRIESGKIPSRGRLSEPLAVGSTALL